MPSDARLAGVMDAFSALFAAYRSAVAATLEELRGSLTSHAAGVAGRTAQLEGELGPFAAGRLDAERLGGLLGERAPLAPAARDRLERAAAALQDIAAQADDLMCLRLNRGADLTSAVRARLAAIGGAFAAARIAAGADRPTPITPQEDSSLAALPFREWTPSERRLAPPLVVSIDGSDFKPAGLAEFLDGTQKIVLLVDGECPPAPLVRLITPGVLVAQSHALAICEQIARWPGPAIAAVVPESCARFVHDPSAGAEVWLRLQVHHLPADPLARAAGLSAAQQIEELRQLAALGQQPGASAHGVPAAVADDSIDRLAAWLLRQANLPQPAGGD
jgi:hypothetical protein